MEQSVGALRDAPPTIWFQSRVTGGLQERKRSSNRKEEKRQPCKTEHRRTWTQICPKVCCEETRATIERWLRPGVEKQMRNRCVMAEMDDGPVGMCRTLTAVKSHAHMHAKF